MTITVEIPMALPSVANQRLHWAKKARQVKAQRNATALILKTQGVDARIGSHYGDELVIVRLTRIAPRRLDDDNLAAAFKAVRDQVAECLGVDDGSPRIRFEYAQRPGKAAVRIDIAIKDVAVVVPMEARCE